MVITIQPTDLKFALVESPDSIWQPICPNCRYRYIDGRYVVAVVNENEILGLLPGEEHRKCQETDKTAPRTFKEVSDARAYCETFRAALPALGRDGRSIEILPMTFCKDMTVLIQTQVVEQYRANSLF